MIMRTQLIGSLWALVATRTPAAMRSKLIINMNAQTITAITPSVRYYSQNEAEFFKLFYPVNPGATADVSSDYRLSSYGALSFGLKGEYVFQTRFTGDLDMRAVMAWDRYTSSGALAHVNVDEEHPGLVSYSVVTFGFSIKY